MFIYNEITYLFYPRNISEGINKSNRFYYYLYSRN